jgi:hypothetical protein
VTDILLVDFGTRRVKSVAASVGRLEVLDEAPAASPDSRFGPAGDFEGKLNDGRNRPGEHPREYE